jgi:dUTP pyrophosphatase
MSKLSYYKIYDDVEAPEFATEGSACFDICSYFGDEKKMTHGTPRTKVVVYTMDNKKEEREPNTWAGRAGEFYTGVALFPGERILVPTGLIFDIPEGHSVRIHPRSSVSLKQGLMLGNAEGVIDSDYYHQTFVMFYNASADEIRIRHKERIAQGELVKTLDYSVEETIIQPEQTTSRVGGFGSTGVTK